MRFSKNAWVFLVAAIGGLLALQGVGLVLAHGDEERGGGVGNTQGGGGAVIEMTPEGFAPEEVAVVTGETVVFENRDTQERWPASNIHPTHRLYPGSGIEKCGTEEAQGMFDACRALAPGETFSFVPEHPGEWRYHDHLRPVMKGVLQVEASGDTSFKEAPAPRELDDAERVSFFRRIWQRIVEFLKGLFNIPSSRQGQGGAVLEERGGGRQAAEAQYVYDPDIAQDTAAIFKDDDALYSYIRKFGPAAATRRLHALSPQFGNCHNRAHDAGRISYDIHGAEAFQRCEASCHSGCYHGATEAFFREHGTSDMAMKVAAICDEDLNRFFSHQCFHGIGHGLMAWADYDLPEALDACDTLPRYQDSCHTGVFMENIVGGLADEEGHVTEYLSDDPLFPCNSVAEKYKQACYLNQTSRILQLFPGDFARVAEACGRAGPRHQYTCFASMGRDVGGTHSSDPEKSIAECMHAPFGSPRTGCLTGVAQNALWDPSGAPAAQALCRMLEDTSEKRACYATIIERAGQILFEDDARAEFCGGVEEAYQEQCLRTMGL